MLFQVISGVLSLVALIIRLTVEIVKIPFVAIYFRLTKRSDLAELAMEGYLVNMINDLKEALDHVYDLAIGEA